MNTRFLFIHTANEVERTQLYGFDDEVVGSPHGGDPHDDRQTLVPPILVARQTMLIGLVVHLIGMKHQSKCLGPHTKGILHYVGF